MRRTASGPASLVDLALSSKKNECSGLRRHGSLRADSYSESGGEGELSKKMAERDDGAAVCRISLSLGLFCLFAGLFAFSPLRGETTALSKEKGAAARGTRTFHFTTSPPIPVATE